MTKNIVPGKVQASSVTIIIHSLDNMLINHEYYVEEISKVVTR